MPLYIAQSGDLDRCYRCLTDWQTLKDRATQLLIKYKSGALVTQSSCPSCNPETKHVALSVLVLATFLRYWILWVCWFSGLRYVHLRFFWVCLVDFTHMAGVLFFKVCLVDFTDMAGILFFKHLVQVFFNCTFLRTKEQPKMSLWLG